MAFFRNAQRQLPEMWIMSKGAVTVRQTRIRYNLRTDEAAENMLNNLVRERRLVKREEGGVTMWDVPRRRSRLGDPSDVPS